MPVSTYRKNFQRNQRIRRYRMPGPRAMTRPMRPHMTSGRVKRIIDAELKFRDLDLGPIAIPVGLGAVIHVSDLAQGDTASQRQGNWVKPSTWMGSFTMQGNPLQVDQTTQFRVIVVCWKENQDLNPILLNKVVQDPASPHQGFNIQNKGQFKVLHSRIGILSNDDDNPQFQKLLRYYVRPSMKVLFSDADFKNNHLFLFIFHDAVDNSPTVVVSTRLRYTDS